MQTNTRLFQSDMNTTNGGGRNELLAKMTPKAPENIKPAERSASELQDYKELALEKAEENGRMIKERASREILQIQNHIGRLQAEYEIDASLIEDRITEKQSSLSRLRDMLASMEEPRGFEPAPAEADDLYSSINQQTKKLSILTAVLGDFLGGKRMS